MLAFVFAVVTFTFGGGSDADAVTATAIALSADVCVLADSKRLYDKANLSYRSAEELRIGLKNRFELSDGKRQQPQKELWGVGPYPADFFYKQRIGQYSERLPTPPLNINSNDETLTLSPKNAKYLALDQLRGLFSKKPLKVSWFFEQARVSIYAKDMSRSALAKIVANALGGRLTDKADCYSIGIDAANLRERAIALFRKERLQATTRDELVDATYHEALYQALTDRQITDLYVSPSSELQLQFDVDSPLGRAAVARLWNRIGEPNADERALSADQLQLRQMVESHVDYSLGIWAVVKPDGVPSCMIRGRDGDKKWGFVF